MQVFRDNQNDPIKSLIQQASEPEIPHAQVVSYLRGQLDREQQERIRGARDANPAYRILFELIDSCLPAVSVQETPATDEVPLSSARRIDDLLMRLSSGNTAATDAHLFVSGLLFSARFYRRILSNITRAISDLQFDVRPDSAKLKMKSDDDIFKELFASDACAEFRMAAAEQAAPGRSRAGRRKASPAQWWRRPVFAFAGAAVVVTVIVLFLVKLPMQKDRFAEYTYDETVPYSLSAWRDSASPLRPDAEYNLLYHEVQQSLSRYVHLDYTATIVSLERLSSRIEALAQRAADDKSRCLVRDYHFYLGVSYFALFRSRTLEFDSETRLLQSKKAIEHLGQAHSLAQSTDCAVESGREAFFLGLAYGFAGNETAAVSLLRDVSRESPFYARSARLLQAWGKP